MCSPAKYRIKRTKGHKTPQNNWGRNDFGENGRSKSEQEIEGNAMLYEWSSKGIEERPAGDGRDSFFTLFL